MMSGLVSLLLLASALGSLEVEDVLKSARAHAPALEAADAEVAAAQGEQLAARGGFDPAFSGRGIADVTGYYRDVQADALVEQPTPLWGTSLFAGYRIGRGSFPEYAKGYETNDLGEVRAGVNVPLLRNGPIDRRRAGLQRAQFALDGSTAQRSQIELDVTRAAAARYFSWAGAAMKYQLAAKMLALATDRNEQIRKRVDAGDLPDVERIDNERLIAQRRAALIAAERAVTQTAIELSLFLRDDDGRPRVPKQEEAPSSLAVPEAEPTSGVTLIERALNARPDLQRSIFGLRQIELERDVQHNQLWPGLDFRVVASQDLGPGSPTRSPFELTVGVYFDIPLLFRLQRGRLAAAEANVARVRSLLRFQRDRIAADVLDAQSAERAAIARLAEVEKEQVLAVRIAELELVRFDQGESTMLMVNLRETAGLEAQSRAVDAVVDARRALVDLAAVTAMGLPAR